MQTGFKTRNQKLENVIIPYYYIYEMSTNII